jgi:hypothetical protein
MSDKVINNNRRYPSAESSKPEVFIEEVGHFVAGFI